MVMHYNKQTIKTQLDRELIVTIQRLGQLFLTSCESQDGRLVRWIATTHPPSTASFALIVAVVPAGTPYTMAVRFRNYRQT